MTREKFSTLVRATAEALEVELGDEDLVVVVAFSPTVPALAISAGDRSKAVLLLQRALKHLYAGVPGVSN